MATIIIKVDDKQALEALRRLNDSIDKTGRKAEKGFDKAGLSIGATAGIVGTLSTEFIQLAKVAATAFLEITKGAINLNKEAELTRLSLIAIFEGNEKAADAFIDTIGDLATKLGTSRTELTQLAKGILPDVGSIEGTAELLENVIVLGRDAGQNIQSIRIATEEALGGNLSSLQRRLNIAPAVIDSIIEYNKTMTLADAINKGLAERVKDTGIGVEVTADSFVSLEGAIRSQFETLQRELGVAPFEELKEQARAFLELFEEKGPDITRIAKAFGDLAANVIEFVGTNLTEFIDSIDFEGVEDLVDALSETFDAAELLLDVLSDIGELDFNDLVASLTELIENTKAELEAIAEFSARARAEIAFTVAQAKVLGVGGKLFADAEKEAEALAAGMAAFNAVLEETDKAFDKFDESQVESTQRTKDRRKAIEDTTEAGLAEGKALLDNKKALEDLADAQAEAAKAQEEISKKTTEFEEDQAKRLTAIIRKEADRRFDDAVKAAQRREDIARKNVDAIEDIFRKNEQAISDAATDLSRDEQDIARKGARDRRDIERSAANERLDVERNFRQELQNIQRQFNQSAQDAERTNDAQAFLQAVRARDEQIEVAKSERDVGVVDVGRNAQEQRAALKVQLAQEVEDTKIANTRKLEDLQQRLNQEFEAQAIKNERDLEQQAIQEQRQQEKRNLDAQRTLEDFERTEAEKQTKLNTSLEKQFALLEAAKAKEIELTARTEAEKTSIVEAAAKQRLDALRRVAETAEAVSERSQTGRRSTDRLAALERGPTRGLLAGGPVSAGETVTVGEGGIEAFTAPANGFIIPNQAMFSPPGAASGMGANVNNSRNLNVGQMGINPGDGILSRMVQNEVSKMLELRG